MTMNLKVSILKGLPERAIAKGQITEITLEEAPGYGVRVTSKDWDQYLWLSGNRKYLPPKGFWGPGDRINLHTGDPTKRVTCEVL